MNDEILERTLHANNLAATIELVLSDIQIRQRAAALGEKIRAEDGVVRAIAFIDSVI